MRLSMLRILIAREVRRLQKNPTALMLIGLLAAVAVLMATSRPPGQAATPPALRYWMVYDLDAPWIDDLVTRLPDAPEIVAIPRSEVPGADRHGTSQPLAYPPGDHGVEIQLELDADSSPVIHVTGRYSGRDPDVLTPFWNWFWPATTSALIDGATFRQHAVPRRRQAPASAAQTLQQSSVAEIITPELIGAVLLLIVQFFSCCHLLVSFTSQDRERGTLMALSLSPATSSEILAAKFLFHLGLSTGGSMAIVAILQPSALLQPALWISLLLTGLGLTSVGTCISTFARSQAAAGLLALCYMLAGAVLFYLSTKFSSFGVLRQFVFENYSFGLFYRALKAPLPVAAVTTHLTLMSVIVLAWFGLARSSFVRFGWK